MKKIHLLWKLPLFFIVLVFLINTLDFIGVTKIKLVDGLTGVPLKNINIYQDITGRISMGPSGFNNYHIRSMEKITDSEGVVSFPAKLHIHAPISKWFDNEAIFINQHSYDRQFNDNYYSGYVSFRLSHLLPYKSQTIKLIPYVNSLSQCNGDKECISQNSYDLAILNNDESLCENLIDKREKEWGNFLRNDCYSVIAVSKSKMSLCDRISSDDYQDSACRNMVEKRGKEICDYKFGDFANDRRFRFCEKSMEDLPCKQFSEKTCPNAPYPGHSQ